MEAASVIMIVTYSNRLIDMKLPEMVLYVGTKCFSVLCKIDLGQEIYHQNRKSEEKPPAPSRQASPRAWKSKSFFYKMCDWGGKFVCRTICK